MSQIIPMYVHIDEHPYKCGASTGYHCYHVDTLRIRHIVYLKGIPANFKRKIIESKRMFNNHFTFGTSLFI